MHYFVVAAKLRVFVLDGVEAVWTGCDNRVVFRRIVSILSVRSTMPIHAIMPVALSFEDVEAVAIQHLYILLGHHLPQVLVADAACWITCAGLFRPEDGEVDLCRQQDFRYRGRDLLVALIERTHAANPVEYV